MNKEEQTEEQSRKSPFIWIGAIFLILLLTLWVVPYYAIRLDPEPKVIPTRLEVIPEDIKLDTENKSTHELPDFVNPKDPVIKQTANKIATIACDGNKICQAKAIFYFVRDSIEYVSDPINSEYIEDPKEVLVTGGADCESGAILLVSLEEAIGVDSQLVLIPGHVYARIKLDKALGRYKRDNWIYLDPTCRNCDFGELPIQNLEKPETYLEVP